MFDGIENMEITAANGKTYKNLRAFHIAIGIAVRNALLDFYQEVKQYAIETVTNWYMQNTGNSEYYDNTYGMISALESSDDFNGAISYYIRGSYLTLQQEFEIYIDWDYLESHFNGTGMYNTYMGFDRQSVSGDDWEEMLRNGLNSFWGESKVPFDLMDILQRYIDKHLDKKINNALKDFGV